MVAKLKNILNDNNRYYVLGISNRNGVSEYQLIQILFINNELKIENRKFSTTIDEKFKEHLKKDYPLILHIEGDNIINKTVDNKPGYRKNIVFKANLDDFHFFEYSQEETVFVSVARKQFIDNLIKELTHVNCYVIHLSLGPFVMANLLPMIKNYSNISSSNYTIEIDSNKIISFKNQSSSQKEYILNNEILNQYEIPLMASFLDYKFSNENIEFDIDFLKENENEFKFKKRFKIAGIFMLAFFIITLFTSHILLDHYQKSLTEKKSEYAISQQTIIQINELKEEKILKEKILQTNGVNHKRFITKYISDIGNTIHKNIALKSIDIIPLIKKIRRDEKINFDFDVINISGETSNDKAFNAWVKNLKELLWVERLDIIEYSQETEVMNSFIIKIQI
ncbi:hypothetical protein D7030_08360 [Flavobacteriaceae bacterium AU392]|nr:hypothetical protein D1817_00055 [Flavobacteriaceae bacterium]RKM85131.1 hypothetical protein D7030_08360 [Flavobacteriaceae bacterium AU392]